MEKFVKGDVVVLPFPFSDLRLAKRIPHTITVRSTCDHKSFHILFEVVPHTITGSSTYDHSRFHTCSNAFHSASQSIPHTVRGSSTYHHSPFHARSNAFHRASQSVPHSVTLSLSFNPETSFFQFRTSGNRCFFLSLGRNSLHT